MKRVAVILPWLLCTTFLLIVWILLGKKVLELTYAFALGIGTVFTILALLNIFYFPYYKEDKSKNIEWSAMGMITVLTLYLDLTNHKIVAASAPLYILCLAAASFYATLFINRYSK
jgi:hypothetical protein